MPTTQADNARTQPGTGQVGDSITLPQMLSSVPHEPSSLYFDYDIIIPAAISTAQRSCLLFRKKTWTGHPLFFAY
jgi:hypothetical protein